MARNSKNIVGIVKRLTNLGAVDEELAKLNGVVAGTTTASKVLMVGADKNVDVLAVADLKLGSGAGTSVTATAAELNYLDIATLGTGAASKAVVLNADGDYTFPATATITMPSSGTATFASGSTLTVAGTLNVSGALQIGGVAVGATAAELNQAADMSAATVDIAAAGALNLAARTNTLAVASGGAVTLAAPTANEYGLVKHIVMTTDDGDVTLALTNVVGGSQASTATFGAVGDALTLIGSAQGKWVVLDEHGVTLS